MTPLQDASQCQWWPDATIVAIDDENKKLIVQYNSGKRQESIHYWEVPKRIATEIGITDWSKHQEVVQAALKIIRCKAIGQSVPQDEGLWHSTYDLIYKMAIQHVPFNYSDRLYKLASGFLEKMYSPLWNIESSRHDEFLKEFLHILQKMPSPHLIAKEIDRLFDYLNRFYVPNTDNPTVKEKVLQSWALIDWTSIVNRIIEPCNQTMKKNPCLVANITQQFERLLPTSAIFARSKVSALKTKAVTTIISQECNTYAERNALLPVPTGVCQIIAEFTIG